MLILKKIHGFWFKIQFTLFFYKNMDLDIKSNLDLNFQIVFIKNMDLDYKSDSNIWIFYSSFFTNNFFFFT